MYETKTEEMHRRIDKLCKLKELYKKVAITFRGLAIEAQGTAQESGELNLAMYDLLKQFALFWETNGGPISDGFILEDGKRAGDVVKELMAKAEAAHE